MSIKLYRGARTTLYPVPLAAAQTNSFSSCPSVVYSAIKGFGRFGSKSRTRSRYLSGRTHLSPCSLVLCISISYVDLRLQLFL